ncbi:MAG: filamentous hemagglutinin N-terminal domain-containing protein [Nostoc sp. DedQUE12b]|uniref:two-partner secretion domain-containing protein n=1 Tax=Nostoc sp. DedQUE12b TaxID=3075398 RepID=UPI002AD4E4FC|nr:filamentous hemagglutinin N-terminal domain-containing protein [Nostoc sp. DedQUE12b]MDZ8085044.1 filamentous hemagglutinin N-terminal domain-containing protein [Nostoc sp. DedQUE12b]
MTQSKIPTTTITIQTHLYSKIAICVGIGMALAFWANCAFAQIAPDDTLPINSAITFQGNTHLIEGGTRVGSNLFHSFREFSVPTGDTAFFNNAPDIQNIISRVTGGSVSNIDGLIRSLGMANLFLLNPNGIIFGENASLNIGGSFVASTANALQFRNLGFFSATEKNLSSPLLKINPSALVFNQINQNAAIQNNSVAPAGKDLAGLNAFGLRVADGKSLLLMGGNVSMDSGRLNAFGGTVELGGLAESGNVNLLFDGNKLSLGFPENVNRASVFLSNQAGVYVEGGGNIAIFARNLDISESVLKAGMVQGLGSTSNQGGDIILDITDAIRLGNLSVIQNVVNTDAMGNSGNVIIKTGTLNIKNGSQLIAGTLGQGNAGSISIDTRESISIDGGSDDGKFSSLIINTVLSPITSNSQIQGGDIRISTKTLSLTNGAQLEASTSGKGQAGSIFVNSSRSVFLDGVGNDGISTAIRSDVKTGAVGNGGKIVIETPVLELTNGAELVAGTSGQGRAGDIMIRADHIAFDGVGNNSFASSAGSAVRSGGVGQGGNIQIQTGSLFLTNGGFLTAATLGEGNAGSIIVRANSVYLDGVGIEDGIPSSPSGMTTLVYSGAKGTGGEIRIETGSLSVTNGAQINAATQGQGNTGRVTIHARDRVSLSGFTPYPYLGDDLIVPSAIIVAVGQEAVGNASDLTIETNSFSVTNYAILETATYGQGDAGNIRIDSGSFSLRDDAIVSGSTYGKGNASNIRIETNFFEALSGGQISTITSSNGRAGKITVSALNQVFISGIDSTYYNDPITKSSSRVANIGGNSGLFVSAFGSGITGDIEINSPKIILDNQGRLNADSVSGNGGNLNLNSDLLLLRHGSQISTNAGTEQKGGNGGNINIDSKFIVAVPNENSDITANAFNGSGGKIQINATKTFGIAPLSRQDLERLRPLDLDPSQLPTNDITAVSQENPSLSGTVQINTPDVDPSRGLVELLTNLVDPSTQIAQGCSNRGRRTDSRFIATGRSGLPESPHEPLRGRAVIAPWVTLESTWENKSQDISASTTPSVNIEQQIIEAQKWVADGKGNIHLIAEAPANTPVAVSSLSAACAQ